MYDSLDSKDHSLSKNTEGMHMTKETTRMALFKERSVQIQREALEKTLKGIKTERNQLSNINDSDDNTNRTHQPTCTLTNLVELPSLTDLRKAQ